jgi:hypothetical protein
MLNSEELLISFPTTEDKIDFMKWFNRVGFNQYLKDSKTTISCVSTFEFGEMPSNEEYQEIKNGFIELE